MNLQKVDKQVILDIILPFLRNITDIDFIRYDFSFLNLMDLSTNDNLQYFIEDDKVLWLYKGKQEQYFMPLFRGSPYKTNHMVYINENKLSLNINEDYKKRIPYSFNFLSCNKEFYEYIYCAKDQLDLAGKTNRTKRKALKSIEDLDIRYYLGKDVTSELIKDIKGLLSIWKDTFGGLGRVGSWYSRPIKFMSQNLDYMDMLILAIYDKQGQLVIYSITEKITNNSVALTDGKANKQLSDKYYSLSKAIQYLEVSYWAEKMQREDLYFYIGSGSGFKEAETSGADKFKNDLKPCKKHIINVLRTSRKSISTLKSKRNLFELP
ncbi:hypothetical protein ThvES_00020310 [Thiovulum sp. ES]|nr:hypothetical protein ThvES_00020310 [Thiovulum sp. ES]